MQVEINTDRNIEGREALTTWVNGAVKNALSRFSERITRVEVHLSDKNSESKGGKDDVRCVMEARLKGHKPFAATDQAATVNQAVNGAADKLTSLIESTLGRLRDQNIARSDLPPLEPINT